jgi:hypothetical protein
MVSQPRAWAISHRAAGSQSSGELASPTLNPIEPSIAPLSPLKTPSAFSSAGLMVKLLGSPGKEAALAGNDATAVIWAVETALAVSQSLSSE